MRPAFSGLQSGTYDRGWMVNVCISKLCEARSGLYQRRFLQPNTQLKSQFKYLNYFSSSRRYTHLCTAFKKQQHFGPTFFGILDKFSQKIVEVFEVKFVNFLTDFM